MEVIYNIIYIVYIYRKVWDAQVRAGEFGHIYYTTSLPMQVLPLNAIAALHGVASKFSWSGYIYSTVCVNEYTIAVRI